MFKIEIRPAIKLLRIIDCFFVSVNCIKPDLKYFHKD